MVSTTDLHWRWFVALVALAVNCSDTAGSTRHMEHFIRAVEQVEAQNPGLQPVTVLKALRRAAAYESPFTLRYLGALSEDSSARHLAINSTLSAFLAGAMNHRVTDAGVEEGVVLTADGTTVALAPLLLGLEAGLQAAARGRARGLRPLALAVTLAKSFLRHFRSPGSPRLGPGGCWDSVASPGAFSLSGAPSLATDALVAGGMDGVILGAKVSAAARHPRQLSGLLRRYYGGRAAGLVGPRRRQNFERLVTASALARQVRRALNGLQGPRGKKERAAEEERLDDLVKEGVKEFVQRYLDCPAIIPRCMWEAKPYRGTPTLLSLPLSFMYIHHTVQPGRPCLTFQQCAADMRAMQRFHQEDRGWDDIGYSFVAGSDGYLYEGRGWHWQGAHTKGHNSKGYGVSFIGDYTASLPSNHSMELVRDQLAMCAVDGGRLVANFTVHGHRQLVSTACPGRDLYAEIQGWKHFGEIQNSTAGERQLVTTQAPSVTE